MTGFSYGSSNRQFPAPQLIGSSDFTYLDLGILQTRQHVHLVGRAVDFNAETDTIDLESKNPTKSSRVSMRKLTHTFLANPHEEVETKPAVFRSVPLPVNSPTSLYLDDVSTIIWATGYWRQYPFLQHLPGALNDQGDICHTQGICSQLPGLFVLGMRFQRRKNSNFLDGVGADAEYLAERIAKRSGASAMDPLLAEDIS